MLKSLDALRAARLDARRGGRHHGRGGVARRGPAYGAINATTAAPRFQIDARRVSKNSRGRQMRQARQDRLRGNAALAGSNYPPIKLMTKQEWEAKQQAGEERERRMMKMMMNDE